MAKKSNVVREFEVTHARNWEDQKGNVITFFGLKLEVDGIAIYFNDLKILDSKKGKFIAYPSREYKVKKEIKYAPYYNLMLNEDEVADVIKMAEAKASEEEE